MGWALCASQPPLCLQFHPAQRPRLTQDAAQVQHGCTCSKLLWCHNRFFITTHPEVEAKIRAELEAHGLLASPETPTPRALAFEDLSGLTYLGAAIKVWQILSMLCPAAPLQWARAACSSLQQQLLGTVKGCGCWGSGTQQAGVLHVQEAMRMKPAVASGTMRVCQKDCTLGDGRCGIVTRALCLCDQQCRFRA